MPNASGNMQFVHYKYLHKYIHIYISMYIQIVSVNEVVPFHEPYIYTIYQTNALEKKATVLYHKIFSNSRCQLPLLC